MKLISEKVENWLALGLAEVATANRLNVYQGQATESNRTRPSIVVVCDGASVTPPFQWRDNERTASVSVYLSSNQGTNPSGDLALHTARCAALEAALQDTETVSAFASDVPDFYLYEYDINAVSQEVDDDTKSRTTRYQVIAKCRDDNGTGA